MLKHFQKYKKVLHAGVILPNISIDQRFYDELGLKNTVSNYEFLRRLCWKGIQDKGIDKLPNKQEYYDRVKKELDVFKETTFDSYVLLNWDFHQFCHKENILTGWGRGSAASSLVLYLLNITRIDPLEYNLYFERFLSVVRAKKIIDDDGTVYLDGGALCDVDSDISYSERYRVIDYLYEKHKGRTAKILTLGTLSSKVCITECCKIVGGMSPEDAKHVSDMIPKKFNIPVSIKEAIVESEKFAIFAEQNKDIIKVAQKLENLIKNTGIHASGIAISHENIEETIPLERCKDDESGEEGVVTGFEMGDVGSLIVKVDVLGLKTLSVVNDTCKDIGIDPNDIPNEDCETYKFLQNLVAPQGLFQLETDVGFRVCQKVRPRDLYDLAAILSIARPGALAYADKYAEFVRTGESQSVHPFFDSVLGRTGSIPIFQEQLLAMLNKIGLSLGDADRVRKCVGKKLVEEMKEWQGKIYETAEKNGLDKSVGDVVWKVADESKNYSFCAGHAFPYSKLSYITAYLKVHHTVFFYKNVLQMATTEQKPFEAISAISQELHLFNIRLLPPDLIKSDKVFKVEGNNIRYALASVKSVSDKTADALDVFRGKTLTNKFEIFNEAKEAGLNIGALCSLIQAGCLDSFNTDRSLLMLEAQVFNTLTPKEKPLVTNYGQSFNYDILALLKAVGEGKLLNDKGKPIISDSRLKTLREKYGDYRKLYDHNHQHKKFCEWYFEKKLLGYSYTHNLRQVFKDNQGFSPIVELISLADKDHVRIVGTVDDFAKAKSKKNDKPYLRINLSDEGGKTTVLFFDKQKLHKDQKPSFEDHPMTMWFKLAELEKDDIIVIDGQKSGDIVFANEIKKIDTKIFSKVSEAKK